MDQIYQNLFSRAADVTGLTYWTQEIKLGNLQLAEIAVHLIWAAQNNAGSADDKKALSNRTEAAVAYTAKIKETNSFSDPRKHPVGIDWVLVGGVVAMAEGKLTGNLNGQVLRRQSH